MRVQRGFECTETRDLHRQPAANQGDALVLAELDRRLRLVDWAGLRQGIRLGPHAALPVAEAVVGRRVVADDVDLRARRHVQAESPVDRVHQHASQPLAPQVGRGPHGGDEDLVGLAARVGRLARPRHRLHRLVLLALDRRVVWLHSLEHLAAQQHRAVGRRMRLVHVGVAEHIRHAAQDRVARVRLLDHAARRLDFVMTVVADPGLAEHLLAEAAGPLAAVPRVLLELARAVLGVGERVRAGAQRHHRHAAQVRVHEPPHRRVVPGAEAQLHHEQVGAVDRLGHAEAAGGRGIDAAILAEGEQHRALGAVVRRQQAGQHRHPFLRAILLVAGHEHHVLAGERAGGGLVGLEDELGSGQRSESEKARDESTHAASVSASTGWGEVAACVSRPQVDRRSLFHCTVRAPTPAHPVVEHPHHVAAPHLRKVVVAMHLLAPPAAGDHVRAEHVLHRAEVQAADVFASSAAPWAWNMASYALARTSSLGHDPGVDVSPFPAESARNG